MQPTERTRVVHHSSLGLQCCGCPDQISFAAGLISRIQPVTVGNSRGPFRIVYLRFILINQYSLNSDHYARALHARTSASFYLQGLSTACATMLPTGQSYVQWMSSQALKRRPLRSQNESFYDVFFLTYFAPLI